MDIKIQETNPTRRSVTVTIPAATVAAADKEVVKGFCREAALPGFRPGKAPEAVVRQKYGKNIADEVSQRLLSDGYKRILEEKSLTVYTIADVQKAYDAGDYATALSQLQPLADAGDVAAMRLLGLMYRSGQGVAADTDIAIDWLTRAADQGDPQAQYALGMIWLDQKDARYDYTRGEALLRPEVERPAIALFGQHVELHGIAGSGVEGGLLGGEP